MKTDVVIVVNPGSTSTKIALYGRNGEVTSQTIQHPQSELDQFKLITDQLDYRHQLITSFVNNYCASHQITIVGAVGRGGIVKPLKGGTYRVNEAFMEDARSGQYGEHASNLGSLLANRIRDEYGLTECFTVDPVSCNNLWPIAEVSGVPEIKRNGRGHPLNMKMTARKVAVKQGIDFNTSKYVVAHLGGGISIALIVGGQLVDINDGLLGMGPFSPNRAGALPIRGVMELAYSMPENELKNKLSKHSGFKAYLGTEDLREVLKMVNAGDAKAQLIYEAFVYQVAKEIGACFAASKGEAQAIIVTGGIAYSEQFTNDLKAYVGKLTEYHIYPGENEMEALAEGAFRVIDGEEEAKEY